MIHQAIRQEDEMYQMVVLIVNEPDDCPAILEAWEALGLQVGSWS